MATDPSERSPFDELSNRLFAQVFLSQYLILSSSLSSLEGVPGEDLVIDSDGFFDLEVQPKKVGVIGAGYIAVELAGVFNGLGSDTSLFVRKDCALRTFDTMLSSHLDKNLKHSGEFRIVS